MLHRGSSNVLDTQRPITTPRLTYYTTSKFTSNCHQILNKFKLRFEKFEIIHPRHGPFWSISSFIHPPPCFGVPTFVVNNGRFGFLQTWLKHLRSFQPTKKAKHIKQIHTKTATCIFFVGTLKKPLNSRAGFCRWVGGSVLLRVCSFLICRNHTWRSRRCWMSSI